MTLKKKHGRNHSQGASGEKNEVKQQGYEDSEKNTKIWSDDDKNREEQSQQQARQEQSQQQAKQTKEYDRDKAKYEEKHSTEESCSQPVPKHPRTDADVQQGQYELKLGEVITTIPEIDFDEEIVEYKKIVPEAQEQ